MKYNIIYCIISANDNLEARNYITNTQKFYILVKLEFYIVLELSLGLSGYEQ